MFNCKYLTNLYCIYELDKRDRRFKLIRLFLTEFHVILRFQNPIESLIFFYIKIVELTISVRGRHVERNTHLDISFSRFDRFYV